VSTQVKGSLKGKSTLLSIVPLLGALAIAAFTGLRMPNLWATTLYSVSVADGAIRRSVFGTVLLPIFAVFGHRYSVAAVVAFIVLVCVLAVLVYAYLSAELLSQRLVILAWLVLPAGAYLFHEVGYLDQVVYLLLFAAIWLLNRNRWVIASVVMVLAVLTHEMALFTTIPLFALVAFARLPRRSAALATGAPVVVAAVIALLPPLADSRIKGIAAGFKADGFPFRPDALELFSRTQSQSWELFSVRDTVDFVAPVAVIVAITVLVIIALRSTAGSTHSRLSRWWEFITVIGAATAPILLCLGGWDAGRWAFLVISNFAIVMYIWLGRARVELNLQQCVALALGLILLARIPLPYFDSFEPRSLQVSQVKVLAKSVLDGSFFDTPKL
jgi:hypothetical protein